MSIKSEWLNEILGLIATKPAEPTSIELCLQIRGTGAWRYCLVHEDTDLPYDYAKYNETHAPRMSKEEFYAQFERAGSLAVITYYAEDPQYRHPDLQTSSIRTVCTKTQFCFQRNFYQ